MSKCVTATEAAKLLDTSLTNVARWCRDGTLPATRLGIGRIWQIPVEAVDNFIPPARGPKPASDRQRLLEKAKIIIAEHPELVDPGSDGFNEWAVGLARAGGCTRARARQALAKAIRMARKPEQIIEVERNPHQCTGLDFGED